MRAIVNRSGVLAAMFDWYREGFWGQAALE